MNRKKLKTKEIFAPVNKKFDRIEIIPHYENECWVLI